MDSEREEIAPARRDRKVAKRFTRKSESHLRGVI